MSFFDDKSIKNKNAEEPWRRSETDKMLDLYLSGATPEHIAIQLSRNPKAVRRRLEQFTYNERDWVTRYEPRQRISRKGKKITQNETLILKAHSERKVPVKDTARLLARSVNELALEPAASVAKSKQSSPFAPTLDVIWAYRYAFDHYHEKLVSDETYDRLVEEEIEYGGGAKSFEEIKRQGWPDHIKNLALYLVLKRDWEKRR